MKELIVKDWLIEKIARENGCGRTWNGHVDAVYQETEKAYKAVMGTASHTVYTWLPKSQCEWIEGNAEGNEHLETKVFDNYEDAHNYASYIASCYR